MDNNEDVIGRMYTLGQANKFDSSTKGNKLTWYEVRYEICLSTFIVKGIIKNEDMLSYESCCV